jgi:hypothetical protein
MKNSCKLTYDGNVYLLDVISFKLNNNRNILTYQGSVYGNPNGFVNIDLEMVVNGNNAANMFLSQYNSQVGYTTAIKSKFHMELSTYPDYIYFHNCYLDNYLNNVSVNGGYSIVLNITPDYYNTISDPNAHIREERKKKIEEIFDGKL